MNKLLAQSLTLPWEGTSGPVTVEGMDKFNPAFTTIGGVVTTVIPFIFAFAGIGLLLMIISAGFTLLTSAGDAKKLDMGKNRLTYALVGFLIIFVAFWVVQIVGRIFGLQDIQTIFK